MPLLKPEQRQKLDPASDDDFYDIPRFVTHVDDSFIQQLTDLYRDRLQPNSRLLDLMSSWVSHLPKEMTFAHVEGHGMNEEELARNPRLDHYIRQNLNQNPALPYPEASFDAVLIAVSVQYLEYPEAVFSEIARVLTPGGLCLVSFSNRMFYQKAIQAWRDAREVDRVQLVQSYFEKTPGFAAPEVVQSVSAISAILGWMGGMSRDPFYAVLAQKK
ncbi:class I SAM-dependent methyltransferase [Lyngbya confervoides]|uniref:Class I SAM-dependent methyltransferase n=1 Tax=Lyngbya confervoides BDU141951 TaxID=1574623 RepID=A0ABD4T5I8_9CYAN|nr:class I SAM-dependent methyltransferase [Lyngbya confervoides]MCM1983794.1 class I SAM-dependent methyltransferase [Lyngbya confervoides BDU141951]